MIFGIKQYRIEITDAVHTDWPSNFLVVAARNRWAAKRRAREIFERYHKDHRDDSRHHLVRRIVKMIRHERKDLSRTQLVYDEQHHTCEDRSHSVTFHEQHPVARFLSFLAVLCVFLEKIVKAPGHHLIQPHVDLLRIFHKDGRQHDSYYRNADDHRKQELSRNIKSIPQSRHDK